LALRFDEIVIGGTYQAVSYSHTYDLPIVVLNRVDPPMFEKQRLDEYKQKLFSLSVNGRVLAVNPSTARITDEGMRIVTSDSQVIVVEFDKAHIFDENRLGGIDAPQRRIDRLYQVLDWFDVKSGMCHEHDRALDTGSDLVSEIVFYPTERVDGNHKFKDLVAISYLREEQLEQFDTSPTVVKFKVLSMMRELGIRGKRNGKNSLYPERSSVPYKYYALKIEPTNREKVLITRDRYENTERLIFER
jgi:hypothetical protein